MRERPYYNKALHALDAAHKACFEHPERDILGMSSGPFSGVNIALGIVAKLESENSALRDLLRYAKAASAKLEAENSTLRDLLRDAQAASAKAIE